VRPDRAAWILAGEAVAMRVTSALRDAEVRCLLIKGPVTERWLYGSDELRTSADIDVLVAPADVLRAEQTLSALGYVSRFDGPAPPWADEHGHAWTHESEAFPIDLHRRLWGCAAPPQRVWDALWAGRETMALAARDTEVLGVPARAMLSAIHVSQHRGASERPGDDLRRALQAEPDEVWTAAARLARTCGAASAFSDGLMALPEGIELQRRLGLGVPDPRDRPAPPEIERLSPGGEGVLRIVRTGGLRARAAVLGRELFPSGRFMRVRSHQARLARRGVLGLIAAYPVRWAYLARGVLSGVRRHGRW
jgi:hypothetical protein